MAHVLQWFNFVQPKVPEMFLWIVSAIAGILVALGIILPIVYKAKGNRWMLEWAKEVRVNFMSYGLGLLIIAWFSSQRVVVLGARAWYVVFGLLIIWRIYHLYIHRRAYWITRAKDEHRKMEQLKYMPGK